MQQHSIRLLQDDLLEVVAMNRKGQLTVFIIIGIVLLFSTALIVYIRQSVVEYKPPLEIVREQVPNELVPMQQYVIDCLQRTAEEGVIRAGLQGGYTDESLLAPNDEAPTEGNAVSFSPGSSLVIPYWWYLRSRNTCENDCQYDSRRLEFNEFERQIAEYVEQRMPTCLDYSRFAQQGFEIEQGELHANVVGGRTVTVTLDYPLVVSFSGREATLSKYGAQIPVNVQRIYDFATDMTNAEIQYGFLEEHTMQIIAAFAGLEKEIPPILEIDIQPGNTKYWRKSEVEKKIQPLLLSYVPALQVHGTTNFVEKRFDNVFKENIYRGMTIPLLTSDRRPYSGISTNFVYLDWWPIYFNIKGRGVTGDLIGPESYSSNFFPFIEPKRYTNYYGVSYSVVIEIKDPSALDGRGYTFMFALEVNVRDNDAVNIDYTGLPIIPVTGGTLLCDPKQRNSGNITINAKNKFTGAPLNEVLTTYSCSDTACTIGYTNQQGSLKTTLPICTGGALVFSKQDYRQTIVPYSTARGKSDSLSVELYPVFEKKISVKKKPIYRQCQKKGEDEPADFLDKQTIRILEIDQDCYWFLRDEESPLLANEYAVISFTKTKEDPAEEEYAVSTVYRGNETFATVQLVPGSYEISMQLLYGLPGPGGVEKILIASRPIVTDKNSILPGGKEGTTIDAVAFEDDVPKGGVEIDGSNKYWSLTPEKLYSDQTIEFIGIEAPAFSVASNGVTDMIHEDLGQANNIGLFTDKKRNEVEPR
jgi:hypothetical protein